MTTLYGIHYSPWSLRAKWALAHHGIAFEYREYTPMLSTPLLRLELRQPTGRITVPILIDLDGASLRDSYDIARWADEHGHGAPLFAAGEQSTLAWTAVAEEIGAQGRVLSTIAVNADSEAMRDNVPPFVPKALRPVARPLVRAGTAYIAAKYGFRAADAPAALERMRAALGRVAERLESAPFLDGEFGWSDIAIVCALQFVRPADEWVRLRAGARRAWTRADLADEFDVVLRWRDRVLEERWPVA